MFSPGRVVPAWPRTLPLPDGVILEILVRLPACSIGRFRAVCKAWRAATTHPSFDRALAERPPAVAKVTWEHAFFGIDSRYGPALNFDLFRGRWHRSSNAPRNVALHGSWDGVLCLQPYTRFLLPPPHHASPTATADAYVLWNPLTDACATVPAPAGTGRVIGGYAHPVTRRFHLLHSSDEAVPGRVDLLAPVIFRILRVGGDAGWREFPPLQNNTLIFMRSDRDRPTGRVALLVFDAAHEKFRLMAAPDRPGLLLETARAVVSGGELCVLALANGASAGAMEMWVLDDYSDPRACCWRLRERIRTVRLDGADLSPAFVAATAVEVVEGAAEGEEIVLRLEDRIDAYNVREDAWRKVSVAKNASLLMHRVSVLNPLLMFLKKKTLCYHTYPIFRCIEKLYI
uniref:F-box domain-containing protein n=1 Tax=Setaria italica TaxID=4555 RepID=K3XS68_SETIT